MQLDSINRAKSAIAALKEAQAQEAEARKEMSNVVTRAAKMAQHATGHGCVRSYADGSIDCYDVHGISVTRSIKTDADQENFFRHCAEVAEKRGAVAKASAEKINAALVVFKAALTLLDY